MRVTFFIANYYISHCLRRELLLLPTTLGAPGNPQTWPCNPASFPTQDPHPSGTHNKAFVATLLYFHQTMNVIHCLRRFNVSVSSVFFLSWVSLDFPDLCTIVSLIYTKWCAWCAAPRPYYQPAKEMPWSHILCCSMHYRQSSPYTIWLCEVATI